jgi:hypothetical protein
VVGELWSVTRNCNLISDEADERSGMAKPKEGKDTGKEDRNE